MSLFLGKIHYWLFNKVSLLNTRTTNLLAQIQSNSPQQAEEFWQYALENTSSPLDNNKDLADLIDKDNIHSWLANQILNSQMREAIFINECIENLPAENLTSLKEVFIADAQNLAKILLLSNPEYSKYTAPELYTLLNDYLINGMPCDNEDHIEQEQATYIAWYKTPCSKLELWKRLNVSIETMQTLYFAWISAFLITLNPQAKLIKTEKGLAIEVKI